MVISDKAIELLKLFEGERFKAYKDSKGLWTIGVGSLHLRDGSHVKEGDVITPSDSLVLLTQYLLKQGVELDKYLHHPIKQCQYDAISLFAYNMGVPSFAGSTLLKLHEKGDFDGAAAQFLMWGNERVKGKLQHSKGLYARRQTEAQVYSTGDYTKIEAKKK
jgi:lysozyme